jgi:putative protease
MAEEKEVGQITHYYGHLNVGIIELTDNLKVGDTVHIKGHSDDFTQAVDSMQIEHKDVSEAKAGDLIGIKVIQKVHPHDRVFKIIT